MLTATKLITGRIILTIVAVGTIVSPFLADWNATHIYNPAWPPHAKFHNAQTMSMAVLLGFAALFFTWRRAADLATSLLAAWLFTTFYWLSQVIAFGFPGVAWTDTNLLPLGHTLTEFPLQLKGDVVLAALLAVAAWLLATGVRKSTDR